MKHVSDRIWFAAALLSITPCLLFPLSNPDLFWHLSAAERMLELRAIPASDWLSSTLAGAPWTDFEWLPQLLYYALYRCGGPAALWALKASLMAAAAAVLWRTLKLHRIAPPCGAAAVSLWAAASMTRSDIRPELFSVLGFGLVFLALERERLRRETTSPLWTALLFALWANLHPGFMYGFLLLGLYMAWPHLLAALLGTLAQPFGLSLYKILWRHYTEMGALSAHLIEWKGIRLDNPWHWPYWALLFLSLGSALLLARRRREIPRAPLAALLVCAFSASRHARLAAYFVTLAAPLSFHFLELAGEAPRTRRWCGAAVLLCAAYMPWIGRNFGLAAKIFHDRFVPIQAAEFLARERRTLAGRPLYNPWGWGGYLGWRLYPDFKVFQDGRYIFHPILEETAAGVASPEAWRSFLDRRRIEVALLENLPIRLDTVKHYPDGSTKPFRRPYYALFMPRELWALVHWDRRSLVFVRRSAMPGGWTSVHEFRYARPFDEEAYQEALRLKEIPRERAEAEFRRHQAELEGLPIEILRKT